MSGLAKIASADLVVQDNFQWLTAVALRAAVQRGITDAYNGNTQHRADQ